MEKNIVPEYTKSAFRCPFCNIVAMQDWGYNIISHYKMLPSVITTSGSYLYIINKLSSAKCSHCSEVSLWYEEKMIFPLIGNAENPNPDLPDNVMNDYMEAKNIINMSPRGAAALLRLALQKLLKHIGEKGRDINDDIASLVKNGLPVTIQQALDTIRVVGNQAVHPGTLDINDNKEIALGLFKLINVICYHTITQPKEIEAIYDTLPENSKKSIENRDYKNR